MSDIRERSRAAWRGFRGWRARWQVLSWIGIALGSLVLLGAVSGGSAQTAATVSAPASSGPSSNGDTTPVQAGPTPSEIETAVADRLNAKLPHAAHTVTCKGSVGAWQCTDLAAGDAIFTAHASGPSASVIAVRLLTELQPRFAKAHAKVVAAAKAEARREKAAARRKAAAKARRLARIKAQREKAQYCAQIKHGDHMGLTEAQVKSYCGPPDSTQHQSGYGMTEDYWYYGDVFSSHQYQLAFQNGVLEAANTY
jgi:hypothetical protein